MTNDPDNTPLEAVGDAALEARIVAWVLGQASAFEAAELEELCKKQPEAALFARRMRMLDGLIRDEADEPSRLPEEKRAKVLEVIGAEDRESPAASVRGKKRGPSHAVRRRLLAIAAVLVLLAVLGGLSMPMVLRSRKIQYESPVVVSYSASPMDEPAPPESPSDDFFSRQPEVEDGEVALLSELGGSSDELAANQITAGLRSGDATISRNSIDAILNRPEATPTEAPPASERLAKAQNEPVPRSNRGIEFDVAPGGEVAEAESKPAKPSSSMARVVAGNAAEPETVPVPEVDEESLAFGDADDFGSGWSEGAFGGGAGGAFDSSFENGIVTNSESPAQLEGPDGVPEVGDVPTLGRLFDERRGESSSLWQRSREGERFRTDLRLGTEVHRGYRDLDSDASLLDDAVNGGVSQNLFGSDAGESLDLFASSEQPGTPEPFNFDGFVNPTGRQAGSGSVAGVEPAQLGLKEGQVELPSLAGREMLRRQSRVAESDARRDEARKDYAEGDFESARRGYSESLDLLPDAPLLEDRKGFLKQSLADANVAQAEELKKRGEYNQAGQLLNEALQLDPDNRYANEASKELNDPIRSQPAVTEEMSGNVEELRKKLYMAEGHYNLGEFDKAREVYEEALRVDRYNAAARRGLEKVNAAKSSYYRAAYDQTRAELLAEVDQSWEMTVPPGPSPQELALDLMAEVSASEEPFSTFSLHVSDASFKLACSALERGERPAAESIRPEEFYNAFDYGDPAPQIGEPVACTLEQSAHPSFPQRNLLRVAVRTGSSGRSQAIPLNLTLLLDNSGSMERADRAEGVVRAVEQLSTLLQPGDKVTVAGFSRTPRLLCDRLDGGEAARLNELVRGVPAEGGTNLEQALVLGEELATRQFVDGAQNRMVLFTDGAANLGDADPESLNTRVEELRQNGIAFDAAGFGADGLNDRLLERLTRNGNGRYYVVDEPEEADEGFAHQLAGAFRPAAENVKVQVVFNPERVGSYKLIGFEEHRLKKEDFRNDGVDAAEMAAEEAGVALYQMEVLPEGDGEIGEVRVRFRDAATREMVERHWTIPYEPEAPAFDEAAESLQLAGLAAFAAEKLREAPMAGVVDFSELAPVMARVAARYSESERVAELRRMIGQLR